MYYTIEHLAILAPQNPLVSASELPLELRKVRSGIFNEKSFGAEAKMQAVHFHFFYKNSVQIVALASFLSPSLIQHFVIFF